jgi:hypothetical protein
MKTVAVNLLIISTRRWTKLKPIGLYIHNIFVLAAFVVLAESMTIVVGMQL